MKYVCLLLLALSAVSCQKSVKPTQSAFFVGDSGYVVKKKGLPFLLAAKLTDTVKSFWEQAKDSDTLGKYYKMDKGGAYLYCSIDLSAKYSFETHLLVKATPDGKVLRAERYFHGNYPSCLNNYYEGFQKRDGYFGLRTCGTGSGYSMTKLYLFKDILAQDKQSPLLENGFTLFPGIGEIALDSRIVYGKATY